MPGRHICRCLHLDAMHTYVALPSPCSGPPAEQMWAEFGRGRADFAEVLPSSGRSWPNPGPKRWKVSVSPASVAREPSLAVWRRACLPDLFGAAGFGSATGSSAARTGSRPTPRVVRGRVRPQFRCLGVGTASNIANTRKYSATSRSKGIGACGQAGESYIAHRSGAAASCAEIHPQTGEI